MDPVTLRWVQCALTAAMDLYDRSITGLRLTPVSTKAVDAAGVLFESVRPLPAPADGQPDIRPPYQGLPGHVVIDGARLAGEDGQWRGRRVRAVRDGRSCQALRRRRGLTDSGPGAAAGSVSMFLGLSRTVWWRGSRMTTGSGGS